MKMNQDTTGQIFAYSGEHHAGGDTALLTHNHARKRR
jgi:hypothetical protein